MLSCMMRSRIFLRSHAMAKVIGALSHQERHGSGTVQRDGRTLSTTVKHVTFCLPYERSSARPTVGRPTAAHTMLRCIEPKLVAGPVLPPEAREATRRRASAAVFSCSAVQCCSGLAGCYFEHCRSAEHSPRSDLTRPRRGEENRVRTGPGCRGRAPIR